MVFGGYTCVEQHYTYFRDCFIFDTEIQCWSGVDISGSPIWLSISHGATYRNELYLFGGEGGNANFVERTTYLNSLYSLSFGQAPLPIFSQPFAQLLLDGEQSDFQFTFGSRSWNLHKACIDRFPKLFLWMKTLPVTVRYLSFLMS